MSTLVVTKPYNQVLDGQKHYRTLLQSIARPGTIGQLDDVSLDVPLPLNRASALIALTLFSGDISFYLAPGNATDTEAATEFIRRETAARPGSAGQADFLIFADAGRVEELRQANVGSLSYPDLGATAVVQVAAVSPAPMPGSLRLTLSGPGIEFETVVFVSGLAEALLESRQAKNREFPQGVDVFLTCDSMSVGPCVLALARTTHVQWERA
jgi:alpha-D-ribose 1-methylphosphonate 5-triphosphate synthase subunit PhnH